LAVVLLGAAPKTHVRSKAHPHKKPAKVALQTIYSAPAGNRPTGAPNPNAPFDAILPNGRIVAPIGSSTIVGTDGRGIALSPDGKYVVVGTSTGVVVVDAASMQAVGAYAIDGGVSPGIALAPDPVDASKTLAIVAGTTDNRLHLFDLGDDGTLLPDGRPISMPATDASATAGALVTAIALSVDGRTAYVTHRAGNSVSAVDLVNRRIVSDTVVGFRPAGVALSSGRVFVTNEGFGNDPTGAPDLERSSALDILTAQTNGDIDGDASSASVVPLDPFPDGITTIGGAHPSALTISPDGQYGYICMTGVDRVETVGLTGTAHAVGGISMQLYTGWPYGTQPDAIVGSGDGKRLYVALAGVDAIAIVDSSDPFKLRRLGLLPTGWYPSGLALSSDGRYLYVVNAMGSAQPNSATLQRIDLHGIKPEPVTLSALRYNRVAIFAKSNPLVPAIGSHRHSNAIDHVVFIDADGTSPDDSNVTALARTFASAGNFTPDAAASDAAMQFSLAGTVTPYERMSGAATPTGYPRPGYIFDALARARLSYAGYGSLPSLPSLVGHTSVGAFGSIPVDPSSAFTAISLHAGEGGQLGGIVDSLTRTPQWPTMAIFIVAGDRLIVVSPYARRGYVGQKHLSTVSVLKTEEELLGLPALSLNDLLATDLADFFTPTPDSASFVAPGVEGSASQ
jgi:hypothetical protein